MSRFTSTCGSDSRKTGAIGILAALFATLGWSLNFISPYWTGEYTTFDAVVVRFIVCGIIGIAILWINRVPLRAFSLRDRLAAATLGLIGYAGYVACIMLSVAYAGPVIAPAIVGTVPVILAIIGNATTKSVSWGRLAVPLLLMTLGLGAINLVPLIEAPPEAGRALLTGLVFGVLAVSFWVLFSAINQRILSTAHDGSLWARTGLMMLGTGVGVTLCCPFGVMAGLSSFPRLGFGVNAISLYVSACVLAALTSVAGGWAWNIAVKRLPMAMTGQLISVETLFATLFGLIASHRIPRWDEIAGLTLILSGTIFGVRILFGAAHRAEPREALQS